MHLLKLQHVNKLTVHSDSQTPTATIKVNNSSPKPFISCYDFFPSLSETESKKLVATRRLHAAAVAEQGAPSGGVRTDAQSVNSEACRGAAVAATVCHEFSPINTQTTMKTSRNVNSDSF